MKKLPLGFSLILALIPIFACTAPSIGLFYALENEVVVNNVNKGLPKAIEVRRTFPYAGNVIVQSLSKLFYASVSGTSIGNYSQIEPPSEYFHTVGSSRVDYSKVLGAAAVGSTLYAVFIDASVPKNFTGKLFYKTSMGGSWTEITAGVGDASHKPWGLVPVSDNSDLALICAEPAKGADGSFVHQNITGTTIGVSYTGGPTNTELKAISLYSGNYYFFFNNGTVFTDSAMNNAGLVSSYSGAGAFTSSITLTSPAKLIAVDKDGYVYSYAGSWSKSAQFKDGDKTILLTGLAYSVANAKLYASTTSGLAEIDPNTLSPSRSTSSEGNYFSTDIYHANLWSISGGGSGAPLFVGSNDKGLWSAVYQGSPETTVSKFPGLIFTHE